MRRFFIPSIALLLALGAITVLGSNSLTGGGWCGSRASFHDEFNSPTLNSNIWSTERGSGGGGERQYYAPDAFRLDRGILSIYAEERPSHGYPYTSGIITTQHSFAQKYGHFEMRARMPRGQGFWPAFWMLPVTPHYPVEIDVVEMLGSDPYTISLSNHWRDAAGKHIRTTLAYTGDADLTAGFHTYAVDWSATEIRWSLDGVERFSTQEGITSEPLFLLANLAVGGDWPGYPDETTQFPGIMQIDYIRVYAEACHPLLRAK